MAKTLIRLTFPAGIICLLFISFINIKTLCSEEDVSKDIVTAHTGLSHGIEIECDITKFVGESLKYDVGFWIFNKIGTVELQTLRDGNNIVVTIDGSTTGMIDSILHRHNLYKTTLTLDKDMNRLKPLSTYEKKIKGDKERVKVTDYDYVNNMRKFTIWKNGKFRREREVKLDSKVSDDGISAFYNLRSEMYGEIKDGARFNISTAYKDRTSDSTIYVRTPVNSDNLYKRMGSNLTASFAAEISIDPEVFDSKDGKVVILFTDDFLPIGFIAKNVFGFGDLYGNLEEKTN
ncbi:MAG: DUF3108 domain-containing protein [Candidatus Scalindua sp.]|nr:DUF3108 domain-containing protein [Candidatus Scalindua sp.]